MYISSLDSLYLLLFITLNNIRENQLWVRKQDSRKGIGYKRHDVDISYIKSMLKRLFSTISRDIKQVMVRI